MAIGETLRAWRGPALGWALFAGVAALFVVERLPMFRRDFFSRIPIVGGIWSAYRVEPAAEDDVNKAEARHDPALEINGHSHTK